MHTRRDILRLSGLAVVGFAGCNSSQNRDIDPTNYVEEWQEEWVRGEADPIESTATKEEYGQRLELACRVIGRDALLSAVTEKTGELRTVLFGRKTNPDSPILSEHEHVYTVMRKLTVGQDEVITPNVSFETLREATPRTVTATAISPSADNTHSCQSPVYLRDSVFYLG